MAQRIHCLTLSGIWRWCGCKVGEFCGSLTLSRLRFCPSSFSVSHSVLVTSPHGAKVVTNHSSQVYRHREAERGTCTFQHVTSNECISPIHTTYGVIFLSTTSTGLRAKKAFLELTSSDLSWVRLRDRSHTEGQATYWAWPSRDRLNKIGALPARKKGGAYPWVGNQGCLLEPRGLLQLKSEASISWSKSCCLRSDAILPSSLWRRFLCSFYVPISKARVLSLLSPELHAGGIC